QLTLFFALRSRPPRSPLFPYTTLFRSGLARLALDQVLRVPVSRHEGLFSDLAVKAHLFDLASMRPNEEVLLEQAEDQPVEAATRIDLADRKSTRLNSSHVKISYAVFCLKTIRNNTCL